MASLMENDIVLNVKRITGEREQFVGGDSGCRSCVAETCFPGKFLHALGCDFCHVAKDRRQPLFSVGYCFGFACSLDRIQSLVCR
jgi:hypothetical protein